MSQLPSEARCTARAAGYEHAWSIEHEQLAVLTELVYSLTYITVAAHGGKRAVSSMPSSWSFPRPAKLARAVTLERATKTMQTSGRFALLDMIEATQGRG